MQLRDQIGFDEKVLWEGTKDKRVTEEKGAVDSDESSALKQCHRISPDWSKGSVV